MLFLVENGKVVSKMFHEVVTDCIRARGISSSSSMLHDFDSCIALGLQHLAKLTKGNLGYKTWRDNSMDADTLRLYRTHILFMCTRGRPALLRKSALLSAHLFAMGNDGLEFLRQVLELWVGGGVEDEDLEVYDGGVTLMMHAAALAEECASLLPPPPPPPSPPPLLPSSLPPPNPPCFSSAAELLLAPFSHTLLPRLIITIKTFVEERYLHHGGDCVCVQLQQQQRITPSMINFISLLIS